uniref:Metalloendopeptidase n=1 Tax=Rhipicephalus appendiculatus TaxID=34631 RepID=A0A131YHL7_RHIAP
MRTPRFGIFPAVVLSVLVLKCHAETALSKWSRFATAAKLQIYPDTTVTYYVDPDISKNVSFMKTFLDAVKKINDYTCVQMLRAPHEEGVDILIYGPSTIEDQSNKEPHCSGSGVRGSRISFQLNHISTHFVLRVLLRCLAPLEYEHLRSDRDDHVVIFWKNIKDGHEEEFMKSSIYPPDIPGFPGYTHGSVLTVPMNYLSKNGRKTYAPKNAIHNDDYRRIKMKVDAQRVRLYYRQLMFTIIQNKTMQHYKIKTSKMGPKKSCAEDLM